jgi:hypothetical protein
MTQPNAIDSGNSSEAKLPRKDWILLPGLSLLTICLIATSTDLIARWKFARLYGIGEDCIVFNDPATGARGIPNSVCREKIPEGEVTEYRFNSCGHRTSIECGPKASGAYRIVMMGMRVPQEKTFAALLPVELSRRTGRHVELYNEGMPWRPPHVTALHFNEVLAANPDIILWVIVPSDMWDLLLPPHSSDPPKVLSAYGKAKRILEADLERAKADLPYRGITLLRHFVYDSQSQTITSYLAEKPDEPYLQRVHGPEFLKVEPSQEWQSGLRAFANDATEIETQAEAAGVPLVAVFLPERAQAAMISRGEWPVSFDPFKLDNELRSIIESHGGTYLDILPDFRNIPNTERSFLPLDGHPDAHGHAMISGLLANELTAGAVPALRAATSRNAELERGR